MGSNRDTYRLYEAISKHRRMLNSLLAFVGIFVMVIEDHSWLHRLGDDEVLAVIGWILVAAGIVVRHWAALYLAGHKNRQLVTSGPYALVRNPLYAGNLVATAGLVLLSESAVAGLLVLTGLTVTFLATIGYEERRLLRKFGQDYRDYKDQVPVLIPHWKSIRRLLHSEDIHQVSYQNIRRETARALWLVVAAIALHTGAEYIEHLQALYPHLVLLP